LTPNGQNITNDAANEPSISIDLIYRNKMVIGWRQLIALARISARPAGIHHEWRVSWTFPGVLEKNVFRSDPSSRQTTWATSFT